QPGVDQLPRLVVADRILDHLPQAEHLNPRELQLHLLDVVLGLAVAGGGSASAAPSATRRRRARQPRRVEVRRRRRMHRPVLHRSLSGRRRRQARVHQVRDPLVVVLRLRHQTYPIFSPRRLIVSATSSRAFNVPAQRLSCFSEMRKSPSDIPPCNAFCSVLSIRSGSAVSNVPAYNSMYGRAHWRVDTPFGLCGYIAEAATSNSI